MPHASRLVTAALALACVSLTQAQAQNTYTLSFGAISDDFLGRTETYGITAFDGAYVSGQHDFGNIRLSYTLGDAFENDAVDAGVVFADLSYRFGDGPWRVGVGQRERVWGPSRYTSLVLGRNAPAFPAIYIAKEEKTVTDWAPLRWIGPWDGEILVGTTDDAGQPDNALFLGMRLGFEPTPGLDIELVRMVQFAGDGEPGGFDTFVDVFFGNTNEGDSAGANQLAGLGLSYDFNPGGNGLRIYGQAVGEDEARNFPSCWFYYAGVEARATLFGTPSTLTLEHVDTTVGTTSNGNCGPGTAYGNPTYSYENEGVIIGAAIGSESRSTQLRGQHTFDRFSLDWSVGHFTINDASVPGHSLSTTRETGTIATVGASLPIGNGTLQGIIAHQSFDLDTAGFDSGTRVGINYGVSF